jgi:hypothetical protein
LRCLFFDSRSPSSQQQLQLSYTFFFPWGDDWNKSSSLFFAFIVIIIIVAFDTLFFLIREEEHLISRKRPNKSESCVVKSRSNLALHFRYFYVETNIKEVLKSFLSHLLWNLHLLIISSLNHLSP